MSIAAATAILREKTVPAIQIRIRKATRLRPVKTRKEVLKAFLFSFCNVIEYVCMIWPSGIRGITGHQQIAHLEQNPGPHIRIPVSLAFTHRMLFQDRWTLDLALSYYLQQGEPLESIVDPGTGPETHSIQTDSNRITPAIRISYRWGKNITFETEFGTEKNITQVVDTNITSSSYSTTDQDTSRRFFMLGYRWDF